MLEIIKNQLNKIIFLFRSGTSLKVILLYLKYGVNQLFNYKSAYTGTYFSGNVPHWINLFSFFDKQPQKILEIGSFQGDSAAFLAENFKKANVTCVDTWQGGDEHSSIDFKIIEKKFDEVVAKYNPRILKIKSKSIDFFLNQSDTYDLIYIDGSHYADDVILDLIKAWQVLESGGTMICDDYIWSHYKNIQDNPCTAINAFLELKKGNYNFIAVFRQLWLKKL
jgi:cephalosporin hydroxylase